MMSEAIWRNPYRKTMIAFFVVFVFGTSLIEIIIEFGAGETLDAMADDLFRFTLSAMILVIFVVEFLGQHRAIAELRSQLTKVRGKLAEVDARTTEITNQYRTVMQKQFEAWNLTASEQSVVIMLLKGLSFREIAQLRETREKTVRQQATSVYRKAGVSSRNELAAWFFEDMLELPVTLDVGQ